MRKQHIVTVQDVRRERYEAEARVELKARNREIKRLRGLRNVAARNGWAAMLRRYDARIAKVEAFV